MVTNALTISGIKRLDEQPLLWEVPLGNHGHSRNVIGQLAEELTAAYVGGRRHKSDSTKDYCPDVSVGEGECCGSCKAVRGSVMYSHFVEGIAVGNHRCNCGGRYVSAVRYYESKAVGLTNQAFVYGGRLIKDREFVRVGHSLTYVIWHHQTAVKEAETVEQLRALVLRSIKRVCMLDFEALDFVCSHLEPEPLNSKYGGSHERPEYGNGFRISLKLLEPWIVQEWSSGISQEEIATWNLSA